MVVRVAFSRGRRLLEASNDGDEARIGCPGRGSSCLHSHVRVDGRARRAPVEALIRQHVVGRLAEPPREQQGQGAGSTRESRRNVGILSVKSLGVILPRDEARMPRFWTVVRLIKMV